MADKLRWLTNDDRIAVGEYANKYRKGKIVGRPQATERYTVEELQAMGLIGIYAPDPAP